MNYKEILELTQWLEKSSFTAYSLTVNGVSMTMSKQQTAPGPVHGWGTPQAMVAAPPMPPGPMPTPAAIISTTEESPATPAPKATGGHLITSPIVGTYYESANPETPPFIKVGQRVKKGDTLCILEAMKVMNEITADKDGTVTEIMVANGDMVEARMPLIRLEV